DIRLDISQQLDKNIVFDIQNFLINNNPYIHQFIYAAKELRQNPFLDLSIVIKDHNTKDDRRYNKPSSTEFAVIFDSNELSEDDCKRQVILRSKITNKIKIICDTHHAYDPLHYVLMFPCGNFGWAPKKFKLTKNATDQNSFEINHEGDEFESNEKSRMFVSAMEFYSYKLQQRKNSFLHLFGRLFHQYIVDMYVKIENSRINFIRSNQDKLRTELYQGLKDATNIYDHDLTRIGKSVILPSSFQGGPRHMQELFQDAMAIVRHFGKPDLFITFTCNPRWNDIINELEGNQKPNDRPDIVVRVFRIKLKELIDDIKDKEIFGKIDAYFYVIEFQKRGLPHAHILVILSSEFKIRTAADIDKIVKAEIPDKLQYPQAHKTVINSMIHGPCGDLNPRSPCMKNGKCSKGFPKAFVEETYIRKDGYPMFKRSSTGPKIINDTYEIDNSNVVAHNLFLTTKYDAHINVEICSTIKAVKYLCKYIHKGHDRLEADFFIDNNNIPPRDECSEFKDLRFVSVSEACWRIFHFPLHHHSPSVLRLAVRLKGQQNVVFDPEKELYPQLKKNERTTLTEWFNFNSKSDLGKNLKYTEFVNLCTLDKAKKIWKLRVQKTKTPIGRMYFASPTDAERYCLRLILNVKKGAKSYEDLRTVDDTTYPDFKSAALAMGLIPDEKNLIECINEAYLIFKNSKNLREFVAQLFLNGQINDIKKIWNQFKKELSEDVLIQFKAKYKNLDYEFTEEVFNTSLSIFHDVLVEFGATAEQIKSFPEISRHFVELTNHNILENNFSTNLEHVNKILKENVSKLNQEQLLAYKIITQNLSENNLFFIDGPGGTGKTFLYNTVFAYFQSKNKTSIAVASSGIAALLLEGGQTAHSKFKIPLDINENSVSGIKLQSNEAKLLKECEILIWDEAPMMSKYIFECVDRLFKDIMKSSLLFGGKKVLFGGDFRQILPVVINGGKLEILSVSLKKSYIWPFVKSLKLTQNMRVNKSNGNENYAKYLLKLGEELPPNLCTKLDPYALIQSIYHNLDQNYKNPEFMLERAILAPTNDDVDMLNKLIIEQFPGESKTYRSIDLCTTQNDNLNIPVEYLNSLNLSGLPPHELNLKINQPNMLLRNLCTKRSLCNGTRLIVKGLYRHIIKAEIAIGKCKGKVVLIPKMTLNASENILPFHFQRTQFPIRPAFAFTINKSQGQTIRHVGVYLNDDVFSHGQLYVAMSRVTDVNNIKIAVKENRLTRNVVYKQIFAK
ncbi:unnamed protein product, partial [Brachionus calyciflorus]